MYQKIRLFPILLAVLLLASPGPAAVKNGRRAHESAGETTGDGAVIWRNPADIESRNLFYGPGGREHQPPAQFTFLKEDRSGTSPKVVVQDQAGVKWSIKFGAEARPETAASRLVWAVGYFAPEDYFLHDLQVVGMPAHLHRGQKQIGPDGSIHDVRLKRYVEGERKRGNWRWRRDPFSGTRELKGLRVMMALINNWDVKDGNNAIYENQLGGAAGIPMRIFMVSDLGASFGTTGFGPQEKSKGNLDSYARSSFISKVTPSYVNFSTPSRPSLVMLFNPFRFIYRLRLRWIGREIPRKDAVWMGQLLSRLSPGQIRDAFRAAGYTPQDVEGFAKVVEARIVELTHLERAQLEPSAVYRRVRVD